MEKKKNLETCEKCNIPLFFGFLENNKQVLYCKSCGNIFPI